MRAEKLKRNFWLTSEIECMLNLIKEVQESQGSTATTHYTFVQIASKMKKKGFPNKSPTQIRRKWFQMKSAYLCFKRGNVERLLLIPEKFRPVIAEFVEAESKRGRSIPRQEQAKPIPPKSDVDNFIQPPNSPDAEKPSIQLKGSVLSDRDRAKMMLSKFFQCMRENHKILFTEYSHMQDQYIQYQHDCQAIRDANMISFLKNI